MPTPSAFLRDESGAITVDYVVLLAAGAGLALVVLTAASAGFGTILRVSEEEMVEGGYVTGTWADGIRNYQAYNPPLHAALVEDFAELSDTELDTIEGFVNNYIDEMEPIASNDSDTGLLNDLDFAMSYAYVSRLRKRPQSDETDLATVAEIATKLGWNESSITDLFAAPETDTGG